MSSKSGKCSFYHVGEIDVDVVKDKLAEKYTSQQLDDIAEMYIAAYRDCGMTVEEAWEEIVCDSIGDINIFEGALSKSAETYGEFLVDVKAQTEATRTEARAPPAEIKEKYSINESFENDLDLWDKEGRPNGDTFEIGSTGNVLQGLGAIESDIYMLSSKINIILKEHPEMTLSEIKKSPKFWRILFWF